MSWHKNRYKVSVQNFFFVLVFLATTSVYAVDSCREIFSNEVVISQETREVALLNGDRAKKVIINYQNGVSINVLKDLPLSRHRLLVLIEMFRSVFWLGGRVVQFGVTDALENNPKVNCHGYACLKNEVPGLPEAWLDGSRSMGALQTKSPMQEVLASFFYKIQKIKKHYEAYLETDNSLQDGDVVHYLNAKGESVHSGLIIKRRTLMGRRNWVRSKIGILMTVDLKPEKMSSIYDYTDIEIWRRNPKP